MATNKDTDVIKKDAEIKVYKKSNKEGKVTAEFTNERFGIDDLVKAETLEDTSKNTDVSNKD